MSNTTEKQALAWDITKYVIAGIVGAFVAGAAVLAWGDARYVRRTEFAAHADEQVVAMQTFVTRAEFTVVMANAPKASDVDDVKNKLSVVANDVSWIKAYLLGKKPPPQDP